METCKEIDIYRELKGLLRGSVLSAEALAQVKAYCRAATELVSSRFTVEGVRNLSGAEAGLCVDAQYWVGGPKPIFSVDYTVVVIDDDRSCSPLGFSVEIQNPNEYGVKQRNYILRWVESWLSAVIGVGLLRWCVEYEVTFDKRCVRARVWTDSEGTVVPREEEEEDA